MPTPSDLDAVSYFARTNFRHAQQRFGIKQRDRRSHLYVIGKTGTGKSTLLKTLAIQDIEAGRGLALIDPHGDLVDSLIERVPDHRQSDLVYFNASDPFPLAFNPLERVPPERRSAAASGLVDVFRKLWADSFGPRLEHVLRNSILALLEQPEATLADIPRLFADQQYRRSVAQQVSNEQVRTFWLQEFEKYPERLKAEAISPVQNKVGAFLADPILQRILLQPRSSFDLRELMDNRKLLLVNLSKGRIGGDASALLGALLVARIGLAAMSRADVPENERPDFHLFLDEFQTYSTQSLASILSELRKYHLCLVLAQQFLSQTEPVVREAILGNVGTIICFRIGATDGEILEREFKPEFWGRDLVSLPNYTVYLKLMIDGIVSRPFSAITMQMEK